mmetsp:Transcript_3608/g.6271  ORF Transcript_3608/g.6271 Transcript_3608/m.6271 type:complete len:217 (-) Transcript_3608:19-669(-)
MIHERFASNNKELIHKESTETSDRSKDTCSSNISCRSCAHGSCGHLCLDQFRHADSELLRARLGIAVVKRLKCSSEVGLIQSIGQWNGHGCVGIIDALQILVAAGWNAAVGVRIRDAARSVRRWHLIAILVLDIAIGIGIAVASAEVFVEGNAPVGTRSLGSIAPSVAGLRTLAVRYGYEAGESKNSRAVVHHFYCVWATTGKRNASQGRWRLGVA